MNRGFMTNLLLIVVIVIGCTNFFAQFVVDGYKADPIITGTFMGIAGVILGVKGISRRNGKDGHE